MKRRGGVIGCADNKTRVLNIRTHACVRYRRRLLSRDGNGDAEGARDRRRGQHQSGLQVPTAQRLRGEGRLQVHRQVPGRG